MTAANGQVVVNIQPAHSGFLTALHQACFTGQLEEVKRLLETNSSLPFQSPDEHGLTALHLAAIYGHDGVAEALLTASRRAGFETTAQFLRATDERVGRTALHHAARNGHASVVEVLLGAPEAAPSGASWPDLALVKDGVRQSTAFLLAAMVAGDHVEIVRLLLDRNPDQIHAKVGKPKLTPTDVESLRVMRPELVDTADEASVRPKFSEGDYAVTEEEVTNVADRLRGRGVSVAGHTALHLAASQDNVQVMAYLLKQPDVDVNAIDDDFGMTPLHCAVRTGALRVMKTLLRLPMDKLDVNAQLVSGGPLPLPPSKLRAAAATTENSEEGSQRAALAREKEREKELRDRSRMYLYEGDTALHLALKFGSSLEALETAKRLCRVRHLKPSTPNDRTQTALGLAVERWLDSRASWTRDAKRSVKEVAALTAPQRLVDAIALHLDVRPEVDRKKQEEQELRSALSGLLVVGTLLAGITFAAIQLQPSGTSLDYDTQAVRWFWACDSLSFFYAIFTVLFTLNTLMPGDGRAWNPSLATSLTRITTLRAQMLVATVAMLLSALAGVGAFAAAGVANLPPDVPIFGYVVVIPSIIGFGLLMLLRQVRLVLTFCRSLRRWRFKRNRREPYSNQDSIIHHFHLALVHIIANWIPKSYVWQSNWDIMFYTNVLALNVILPMILLAIMFMLVTMVSALNVILTMILLAIIVMLVGIA